VNWVRLPPGSFISGESRHAVVVSVPGWGNGWFPDRFVRVVDYRVEIAAWLAREKGITVQLEETK
jgi:hypothetical protein